MIGAILGDIIGSRFEFDRGDKTKDFTLFTYESEYTDDTVMTVAVAEALLKTYGMSLTSLDEKKVKDDLINSMKKWGRKYPFAGYGGTYLIMGIREYREMKKNVQVINESLS